ncbi:MAG: SDR family oxidoreductase [Candidatus Thorarchaeota archaeon]
MKIKELNLGNRPLDKEIAIITGAGRGIGRELARALAYLGASVVIAEIDPETGRAVQDEIAQEEGVAMFVETDVSSSAAVQRLVDLVTKTYGRVDILVNNAITVPFGSFVNTDFDTWERTFAVNVMGAIYCTRAVIPLMLEKKHGTVVSCISTDGMPYAAPYFASKSALGSLTQSIALEIGDDAGVAVFNFGPGMVETPGLDEAAEYMGPKLGMTAHEFKHQAFNPGYEGPVPADHAAAGLAIALLHNMEYHGEVADTFSCLSRYRDCGLGVDQVSIEVGEVVKLRSSFDGIRGVVIEFQEDFSKVNRLMRSFATKEFKKQVGHSVEALIDLLTSVVSDFGNSSLSVDLKHWVEVGEKLQAYILNSINILPKYVKNPDDLQEALHVLEKRLEVVMEFLHQLKPEIVT